MLKPVVLLLLMWFLKGRWLQRRHVDAWAFARWVMSITMVKGEVGIINEWVLNNPPINSNVVGPNETSVSKNKSPISSRPPNPTQLLSIKDALAGTCPNSRGGGDFRGERSRMKIAKVALDARWRWMWL